jgi:hypothetical protein
MNSKLSKAIVMLVAAIFLVGVIPPFIVNAQPPPYGSMWMTPSSVSLSTDNPEHTIGYRFNITVSLSMDYVKAGASGIQAWQFNLTYPTEYLDVSRCNVTYNNVTSKLFQGLTTWPSFSVNEGKGYVLAAELTTAGYKEVPCSGSLAWIEFVVTDVPDKLETLTGLFSFGNEQTYVTDDQYEQYYAPDDITVSGATYTFEWKRPSPAYMSIEHDGSAVWPLVYGPFPPPAVGQTFNAQIYVNVAAAWGLTSASFCLCYNTTVIDVIGGLETPPENITINDAVWDLDTSTVTVTHGEPDRIDFVVYPKEGVVPSGKVLVATVKFTVILQEESPPAPPDWTAESPLDFCGVVIEDHAGLIDVGPSVNGKVIVKALRPAPPYMEVVPNLKVLGPDPSIGKVFNVDIVIKNLHTSWCLIAYQVRVAYDPEILEVVDIIEGPFLQDSRWNLGGTFWIADVVPPTWMFPQHVMFADLLLVNPTFYPQAPGPDVPDLTPPVNPVLATIKFKVIKQNIGGETLISAIDILPFWPPEDCHFLNVDAEYIPTDTAKIVNGTVKVLPMTVVGRQIDVYGGAVNRGYGASLPFPAPYGGQGPNEPMDLVTPQSVVYLYAKVTYNYWPVQQKDVAFVIDGPAGKWRYANRTDSDGVAWIRFQMPWPCDDPESILGLYTVTATVSICDVTTSDTLQFKYDYLVNIVKVSTDKYSYAHEEYVEVRIDYKSKAGLRYPVFFSVVMQDDLGTTVATGTASAEVVGAMFCLERYYWTTVSLYIPKHAFAGIAKIFVEAYDKDPAEGGTPWCPGVTTEISIAPA